MTQEATETRPKDQENEDEILDVRDLAPSRKKLRTMGGEIIEVFSPKELSLAQRTEVDRLKANLDRLQERKKLTPAQQADLERTFNKLARAAIVEVTDEQFDELEILDKDLAISVFTAAFVVMQRNMGEGTARTLGLLKDEDDEEETPES